MVKIGALHLLRVEMVEYLMPLLDFALRIHSHIVAVLVPSMCLTLVSHWLYSERKTVLVPSCGFA